MEAKSDLPTPGQWFAVWLRIGLQSFGGGVSTISLMRQELVERTGWVTPDEFTRDFALCQLAPGVNIIGMAVLFGRRLGGPFGIALAMGGLLFPSATATACITAAYAHVKNSHTVIAALRFVMAAVAGLGFATAFQTAEAPVRASRAEGLPSLAVAVLLVGLPALAVTYSKLPTVYWFVAASLIGAIWVYGSRRYGRAAT
jgi:chromate transporter